jgi:thiol peroxidase
VFSLLSLDLLLENLIKIKQSEEIMAYTALQGNKVNLNGELPEVGTKAPEFNLTKGDLSDVNISDFKGKKVVLNIFPSLDTDICAASVRRFNEEIVKYDNTVCLAISKDLPFAHGRFCTAEGIENVISLSELRDRSFSDNYGVRLADGPLAGLLARSVIVVNEEGEVVYTQLVPEIASEPDYEAALAALK